MTIAELRDYLESCNGLQTVYVWDAKQDCQTDKVTIELLDDGSVLIVSK